MVSWAELKCGCVRATTAGFLSGIHDSADPGLHSYSPKVSGQHWQSTAQAVAIGFIQQRVACSGFPMEQLYLVLVDNFLCACIIRVINWVPASKFQESVLEVSNIQI